MIELIYNEEEETILEEKVLLEPKNVRQVGEPKEYKKIFLEDFVHTYLLQYSAGKEQSLYFAVLLGNSERSGGKRHLYVKSALPVMGVAEKQGKYHFSEKIWGTIYQECERYFPEQEILGWFLAKPGFAVEKNGVIEETHRTYFSGADKVLFMLEPLEGENAFWGFDGNRFAKQNGYYIYYEKNEPMREFIMEKNGKKQQPSYEKPDVAMANFRKILKEKKEQSEKRKKKAISYGTKAAIALVLILGGITMKNQTDKIAAMEEQMIVPASNEEVVVEELPGNVEEQPVTAEKPEELPVTEEVSEEVFTEPELPVPTEEPAQETAAEPVVHQEYRVQVGDTLAKISRDFYGSDEKISEICTLNEITDGDYIQAGEIILLP